ncbi:DegT/DnrJ/EryC1/StrS family aminotransferase [Bradyrhizobium sp. 23]|nr:DegT/DnrJ/EryC1/StrS family aminotransferase [Bradyrhizobium sp. 23]
MNVPFYRHDLTAADSEAMARVLATPFLTSGPVGREVEAQIATFHGIPHALLTNSWTNGALAVLLALGVKHGDEVIVPAMTFIASANVVELLGAKPIFVDVDPDTLLMTPAAVAAALTPRTKAIIPVHLYGQMCDVRGMREVLRDRPDVRIVEDCAHCFEGTRDGERPGVWSDAAVFSFYTTKNVACGEGGAITCRDPALYERLQQTRLHGMDATAINRYQKSRYRHWDMLCLGVKANLPDLLAALLPPQIAAVERRLQVRKDLVEHYRAGFADGPLRLVASEPGTVGAEHMFLIHVGAIRDTAIDILNEAGIGIGVHYRSVPTATYYAERYGYTSSDHPISAEWGAGTLTLPLYVSLTRDEQDHVIDTVRRLIYPLLKNAQQS